MSIEAKSLSNDLKAPSPAQKLEAGAPSNPLHGFTATNGKHDHLALLIDSRNPIITVETKEEHRLQDLLLAVTTKLCVPLYTWTVTAGLQGSMALPSMGRISQSR